MYFFKTSHISNGSKFVAKSISSTFSLFIIFLTHPPTYLISLDGEKELIASNILDVSIFKDKSLIKNMLENQRQYSDKDIYNNLNIKLEKIINEKN